VKHALAATTCAALLLGSLTACGSSDSKSTLPASTSGSTPSATSTHPATTAPTASPSGEVPLVPHSSFTFGRLKVVVDQPANLPKASRSSMMVLSEFLQGMGRTSARNILDPALKDVAATDVVKYVQTSVTPGSVEGIGSLSFTISRVQAMDVRTTRATLCLDQSKFVQVRKDGSQFVDASVKKFPRLKMRVDIFRGLTGPEVTGLVAKGSC